VIVRGFPALAFLVAACGSSPPPPPEKPIANEAKPAPVETAIEENAAIMAAMGGDGGSTYGGAAYGGAAYGAASDDGDIANGTVRDGSTYSGWGTIGTGQYGTLGHGSGAGTGGGSKRPKVAPLVRIGNPNAIGDLDKANIRRYIRRDFSKIQRCYEQFLLDHPDVDGRVDASFTIQPTGKVSASAATGLDPSLSDCVAKVIAAIEFPKPNGGGVIQVSYPFNFRPAGK
jgi:hypothetical protein